MRLILAAVAACFAVPVIAIEATLTPEEQAVCNAEGGCVFATRAQIGALLKEAYDKGLNKGRAACRNEV